jgi:glutathione synthase/RimK-type ligase-like ATP-grasp enzyme
MQIAYITYENVGKYSSSVEDEDPIFLSFLKGKGLHITEETWSDQNVDWSMYAYAILKVTWDYFDRFEEWNIWLNKLEQLNIKLLNPVSVVKWNSDKHYLHDITNAGLMVTPTRYCEQNTKPQLADFFKVFIKSELAIKPTVSGGSKNTFRFNAENVAEIQVQIHELLKEEAFMIQPYLEEIASDGE